MTTKLSEELRAEIVAAIEAADLESPEQVSDWVLDAAENGGDWKAELDKAIATDRKHAWQ